MSEPFDIMKLLKAPLTGMYWVKVLAIGLGLAAVIAAGYGVYNLIFKKEPTQTIVAKRGSTVTVNQINSAKRWIIPFVEGWGGVRDDNNFEAGIRVGGRIEF